MDEDSAFEPPPIEPPPIEPPPPPPPVIPWEDPSRPWAVALVETVQRLTGSPQAALASVPARGDVLRPVVFALIVGTIGVFFSSLWELVIGDPFRQLMPNADVEALPRFYYLALMALSPLIIAVSLVFSTLLIHVSLLLVGGARSGLAATLRALCYAQVGNLAFVIPFCGGLLGGVWILVLEVMALSALHRISIGRAIAGVFLPLVLCCGCLGVVFAFYGAAVLAGLKGMMP